MKQLNAYQRKKVMNAAAQTKMENEKRRALYGARTRGATRRGYEEGMIHAREDGITPPGFFRRF